MKKKIEKIKEKILSIKLSLFKGIQKENLGKFKSYFKGNGLQFKDHRSYVYGDDIRDINWSILAKNGSPFIKEYEEERNIELIVLVDISESMLYGKDNKSKLEISIELVCLLYLVAKETNDWISVYFIGGKLDRVKKGRGEEGFFNFLLKLKEHGLLNEDGDVNIAYTYNMESLEVKKQESLLEKFKANKSVIIFSDFHLWSYKNISQYFFSNYWRLFRIASPIDDGVKNSINFVFRSSGNLNNKKIASVNNKNDMKKNKYLKTLSIDDDYLNNFLRELI